MRGVAESQVQRLRRSVVKLFTVTREPNYYKPWQLTYQRSSGGTGCIIDGSRILTNAHVVSNQLYVHALKAGDAEKYPARVLHVDHDTETALLTVDDPRFFADTEAVALGELPPRNAPVTVYGFPVGGNELCVTAGVVSRIEVRTYTHSQRDLLAIQTDAAINPGNSGGPVFYDDKLVGVAFQSYKQKDLQKAGYVIPTSVIRHMLVDLEDGRIDGVPDLGIYWQKIENDTLRRYLGVDDRRDGIRVSRVIHGASADGRLAVDDVLLAIDGVPIASDGTIVLRDDERVGFDHVVSRHQVGDAITATILRDRRRQDVELVLGKYASLVPPPRPDRNPTYLIFAGVVFTVLSYEYIHEWEWAQDYHVYENYFWEVLPTANRREVVILREVLAHRINFGYHQIRDAVIERINGVDIGSMADVIAALGAPHDGFHVIETDDHGPRNASSRSDFHHAHGTRIVLPAAETERATAELLEEHGILHDRSADLRGPGR